MSKSRRDFLTITSLGVLGATAVSRLSAQNQTQLPPGAPTAFGAGPSFGPEVTVNTFAEAEKLVQFPLRDDERATAAATWRKTLESDAAQHPNGHNARPFCAKQISRCFPFEKR